MVKISKTKKTAKSPETETPAPKAGKIIFPNVIQKKPSSGDLHPLSKAILNKLFRLLPLTYTSRLEAIKLRPRGEQKVGDPYGSYSPEEKTIVLYSLPEGSWKFDRLHFATRYKFTKYGFRVTNEGPLVAVKWKKLYKLAYWFYCEVLAKKLEEHYQIKYEQKHGTMTEKDLKKAHKALHSKFLTKKLKDLLKEAAQKKKP